MKPKRSVFFTHSSIAPTSSATLSPFTTKSSSETYLSRPPRRKTSDPRSTEKRSHFKSSAAIEFLTDECYRVMGPPVYYELLNTICDIFI